MLVNNYPSALHNIQEERDAGFQASAAVYMSLAVLGLLCSAAKYHSVLHNIQEEQGPP